MINLIAAVGKNFELGKDNKLIWNIPADMKYFKETTTNKIVVMGRKTFESIGKALPNRENIVISTKTNSIDGCRVIQDYQEVLKIKNEVFIIGGASIYKLFIPYADRIYLTEIDDNADADSFFPKFDLSMYNRKVIKSDQYNNISYSFVIYEKKTL